MLKVEYLKDFNQQYGGEYAHISNPQRLRFILGDNLFQNTSGAIKELETSISTLTYYWLGI